MLNKRYNEFLRQHEEAWTLSYLFPERYGGARIPENHPAPSNTMTLVMDRTVKSSSGNYLGVFSPIIETCAPYFNSYEANTDLPTGTLSDYIVYADNNGSALNVDANNVLNSLSSWNYKQGPSYQKLGAYKRLRIVGACLELNVIDVDKNYSGMIETCIGFEVMGNGFKNDNVDIDKLSNYPSYKTFKTNEEVILKYRYNNEKYILYGPYEPFSCVPFHIIRISGLSTTAIVRIRTIIHVEGLLMPHLVHFATKDIIIQKTRQEQQENHKAATATTATTKTKNDEDHQIYTGTIPPDQKGATTDDGFPRETPAPKPRKKKEDDLLQKRQDMKLEVDASPEDNAYYDKKGVFQSVAEPVISIFGDIINKMTATDVINAVVEPTKKQNQLQYSDNNRKTRAIMPDASSVKNRKTNTAPHSALPTSETQRKILAIEDDPNKAETMVEGLGISTNMQVEKKEPDPLSIQYLNAFINENPGELTQEDIEVYKHYEPQKLFELKRAYDLAKNNSKLQFNKQNTATYNKYELVIDDVRDEL